MSNFCLTLLSDNSLSIFSKNTQCDFKVKLDHSLQIEKDNWEVGLVEIITPTEVNNITKEDTVNIQATRQISDQTARMRRLVKAFAGRTYHIVGNLMLRLT